MENLVRINTVYMSRHWGSIIFYVFHLEDHINNCLIRNTTCPMEMYSRLTCQLRTPIFILLMDCLFVPHVVCFFMDFPSILCHTWNMHIIP